MSSQTLEQLKEQANDLTADDQLRLASYLVEQARTTISPTMPGRSWQELKGLYPYPMLGEDAQAWVSRNRQEGDAGRVRQFRAVQ